MMKTRERLKVSAVTTIAALAWGCSGQVIELPAEQADGSGGVSGAPAGPLAGASSGSGVGGSRPGKGPKTPPSAFAGAAGAFSDAGAGPIAEGGAAGEAGALNEGGASGRGGAQNVGGTSGGGGAQNVAGTSGKGGAQNVGGTSGGGGAQNIAGTSGKGGAQNVGGTSGRGGAPGGSGAPSHGGGPSHGGAAGEAGASDPGEIAGSGGGGGFAPAPGCARFTFVPTSPLLTGASSVALPNSLYEYAAPGLVPASGEALFASSGTFAGIHIQAQPGQPTDAMNSWFGVGVPLAGCIDATAYRGVTFTITGDLGSCALTFGLVTSVNNSDSFVGSCQGSTCVAASSGQLTVGTSVILFADMAGGIPESRVNPATLNDLQWQFTLPFDASAPACVADFTVTDIAFVP